MFNKSFKIINNQSMIFFKSFFFLRYVFAIFFISTLLFFSIPKLFDFKKDEKIVKIFLENNYDLEVKNLTSINYNIFPSPNLSLQNSSFKVKNHPINLQTENMKIFLKFKNIYNLSKLEPKKIVFKETNSDLDIELTKELSNFFQNFDYKLKIESLNINFKKDGKSIFEIEKINFSNYGFKRNKIEGILFKEKFIVGYSKKRNNFNFKINDLGIKAVLDLEQNNFNDFLKGIIKINFLESLIKSNFNLKKEQIDLTKTNFKNKDLFFTFDSVITFNPYFLTKSNIDIISIEDSFLKKISFENILLKNEIIKKLNSENVVKYKANKFSKGLIKDFTSKINFINGNLIFESISKIIGGTINCKGDILLIDSYPRLNFQCSIIFDNTKNFLKSFSIASNANVNELFFDVKGSINILNNKINFDEIIVNKEQSLKEKETRYYKQIFEKFLLDEGLFFIIKKSKVKTFLLELT